MKKEEFRQQLEAVTPDVPEQFHSVMAGTLRTIVAREGDAPAKKTVRRRTWVFVLVGALLIASVALAATLLNPGIFDVLLGKAPENAASITQYNLAKESFPECDIEIKQAAYDGMSLYVVYSIRERNATECLGEYDPDLGARYVDDTVTDAMKRDGIGYWSDSFWIDGKEVNMPGGSYGMTIGSETPGELLTYYTFRLDDAKVFLNSKETKVSLPIGKRNKDEKLVIDREKGEIAMPKEGLVTFTMDTTSRAGVTITHPNVDSDWDELTARVTEVNYTPLMMYLTLGYEVKPEALAAYKEKNGAGYYDEEGKLMWEYSAMDVFGSYAFNLALVDDSGKPVFEDMSEYGYVYGGQGYGDNESWYLFPYLEKYPDVMWLAPMSDEGVVDMTRKIRVK